MSTMDRDDPLPPDVAALIDHERARGEPSDDVLERLLRRVEHTLVVPPAASTPPASSTPPTAPVGPPAASTAGLARALVFVLGCGVGAGVHALLAHPAPRVVVVTRTVSAPALAAPAPAVSSPSPVAIAAERTPPIAPTVARAVTSHDAGARGPSLHDERTALDLARTALARGQADAALDALDAQARRFPRGQLAEERESLRVQALVSAGRYAAARASASSFVARYPGSLFRGVVEASLRSIP